MIMQTRFWYYGKTLAILNQGIMFVGTVSGTSIKQRGKQLSETNATQDSNAGL